MITDGEKWHYLTITRLFALLARITSNHDGKYYCLDSFSSYITKNKLKS